MKRLFTLIITCLSVYYTQAQAVPALDWGTLYGGNDDETRPNISVDKDGSIYMVFGTKSFSEIATPGAFQEQKSGSYRQSAIVKFDSTGDRLWGTYYDDGTIHSEDNYNFKDCPNFSIDPYGNIYIIADTSLGKISATGKLIWIKGLPGFREARYRSAGIQTDYQGNVYITGHANIVAIVASDFVTPGTYKGTISGGDDMFLMKFDSSGQKIWGTFFGGDDSEAIFGNPSMIAPDEFGNVYLTGRTRSKTGIASTGSFQDTLSGIEDAFIAKFNNQGKLLWATYYGGEGSDRAGTVLADAEGSVYLLGETNSKTGIATSGVFKDTLSGGKDFFLVKFDSSGKRIWATYIGGEGDETANAYGHDMSFDVFANIIVYGFTSSPDGIATVGAFQEDIQSGSHTLFLQKITPAGNRLWGTYFGGSGGSQTGGWNSFYGPNTGGGGVATDLRGNIYVSNSGGRAVVGKVTTPNGFDTTFKGAQHDVFLSKFKDCFVPNATTVNGDTLVCANDTLLLSVNPVKGATGYAWILPSGWQGNSDTNSIAITVTSESGRVGIVSLAACGISDTLWQNVDVIHLPIPQISFSGNTLTTGSYAAYQWYLEDEIIPNATDSFLVVIGNGDYRVVVSDSLGLCSQPSEVYTVNNMSIEGVHASDLIQVYPNPVKDFVYIKSSFPVIVSLLSIDGKLQFNSELGSDLKIDFSDFSQGMYLLEIRDQQNKLLKVTKLSNSAN